MKLAIDQHVDLLDVLVLGSVFIDGINVGLGMGEIDVVAHKSMSFISFLLAMNHS